MEVISLTSRDLGCGPILWIQSPRLFSNAAPFTCRLTAVTPTAFFDRNWIRMRPSLDEEPGRRELSSALGFGMDSWRSWKIHRDYRIPRIGGKSMSCNQESPGALISQCSDLKWTVVRFRTTSPEWFPPTRRQLLICLPNTIR